MAVPISFSTGPATRKPKHPDPEFARTECARDVGLDPKGFTAVVSTCRSDIVCAPNSVPTSQECDTSTSDGARRPET